MIHHQCLLLAFTIYLLFKTLMLLTGFEGDVKSISGNLTITFLFEWLDYCFCNPCLLKPKNLCECNSSNLTPVIMMNYDEYFAEFIKNKMVIKSLNCRYHLNILSHQNDDAK